MQKIFQLIEETGLPKGVLNLVNGSEATVNAILDNPTIKAVSFVGSTATARYVYSRATANGKRAQCQGGAKKPNYRFTGCGSGNDATCNGRECLRVCRTAVFGGFAGSHRR